MRRMRKDSEFNKIRRTVGIHDDRSGLEYDLNLFRQLHLPQYPGPLLNEEIDVLPADGAGMRRDQYVRLLPER